MNFTVTGTLKVKKKEEVVSDKFKKREFVLTDNSSQYPQQISFQLTQAKCELIDQYEIGSEITVHFNLRGREWTSPQGETKYFNTLEAWRIEGGKSSGGNNGGNDFQNESQSQERFNPAAENDDLPF